MQYLDKVGMKELLASDEFTGVVHARARELLLDLETSRKRIRPEAPGFQARNTAQEWAETVVQLKQTLLISPSEFRIRYCMPGSRFAATWMQAEAADGSPMPETQAEGRSIAACLFPALTAHDAPLLHNKLDLADILIKNKTFFPSDADERALTTSKVISKAVVLVL